MDLNGSRKSEYMGIEKDDDKDMLYWKPSENLNNANIELEDLSDNDAFALNDKDDLFLSELGNILLEEEKLTDQWEDQNDEDIH